MSTVRTTFSQKIGLAFFGLFLCLVVLEVVLRLGGFIILSVREHNNRMTLRERGAYRIMCLGGSTTADGGKYSYPSQLEQILNEKNVRVKFKVINKGVQNMDTAEILVNLEKNLNIYKPDMVITMVGQNDKGRTVPYEDTLQIKIALFFTGFRVYRLAELLWLRVMNKFEELKSSKNFHIQTMDSTINEEDNRFNSSFFIACALADPTEQKRELDGFTYLKEGRFEEAAAWFQGKMEKYPEEASYYWGMGVAYKAQGDYEESIKWFKKGTEVDPINPRNYNGLGETCRAQGRYIEAIEWFKKQIELTPKDTGGYSGIGWAYFDQGDYEQAIKWFKKGADVFPNDGSNYFGIGEVYRSQDKYKEALEWFNKAHKLNPDQVIIHNSLGWTHLAVEDFLGAIEWFKKAIDVDSENAWNYYGIGEAYRKQKRFKEAIKWFGEAIKRNNKDGSGYGGIGWAYFEQGLYEQSLEWFEEGIKKDSGYSSNYHGAGEVYKIQNKQNEAIENYKKLIEIDKNNVDAYIGLGEVYIDQHKFEEAEEFLNKAGEIEPKNIAVYDQMALIYGYRGYGSDMPDELKERKKLSEKIIKLGLENGYLSGFVATTYNIQGKYKQAEEYYKKAERFRLNYYKEVTRHNYRKIKEMVAKKGIKLICVQYPVRSVKPLRKLFDSTEGMVFVDNEKIFKDALKDGKYDDYFIDTCGGDFGHCTPRGNRLLAENIAKVILQEVFDKAKAENKNP